jgi:hypothetical protein
MDEDSKTRFKWKFYQLTIQLNLIVLLAAVSVIVFFLFHSPYTIPLITGILILILILSWDFLNRYRKSKAWLEEHSDHGKET